jgi:hypothetical protein
MDIIKLPAGERAPTDSDCISIEAREDGRFTLNCSALANCDDPDETESIAVIGGDPYDSYDAAEAAGLAWAADRCVEQIYVATLPVGTASEAEAA